MPSPQAVISQNAGQRGFASRAPRWLRWLLMLVLLSTGFALRITHLTAKPFWFDECFSVELAWLKWRDFLRVLWWREANMTFYYVLLRGWLHFGHGEFFIRSLSVALAVATIPAIYWLATLLYERRVAWIAAVLFTCNAYSVRFAQESRSYALFALLATLSSAYLIAWLREPRRIWRIGYLLTTILAVYSHLYTLLLLLVQWFVIRGREAPERGTESLESMRRTWKIVAFAVLPLLIFVAKTGAGPIRWIHRPTFNDLATFWRQFTGGTTWLLPSAFAIACLAAALPYRKRMFHREQDWATWRVQFLLLWVFFPMLLTVLLSFARPVFLGRYMIFCLPALLILTAAGLARLRSGWLIASALALVLVLSLQGVAGVYEHDFDDQRDGSAAATNFILDHGQPGDGIIFHIAEARVPYEFFRSERAGVDTAGSDFTRPPGPEILFPHTGTGLQFGDFKAKLTPDVLRTAMAGHPRVWVFLIYNGDAKPDGTTNLLTQTLREFFAQTQTWRFPRIEVRLYSAT